MRLPDMLLPSNCKMEKQRCTLALAKRLVGGKEACMLTDCLNHTISFRLRAVKVASAWQKDAQHFGHFANLIQAPD